MLYDLLIIGGGVSSISCALVIGSAHSKSFMADKKIGIIAHQRSSSLQNALFNNAYGIAPGTLGSNLLNSSIEHLNLMYPHIDSVEGEKVIRIEYVEECLWKVHTNKSTTFTAKNLAIGIGSSSPISIQGLENYVIPHKKALASKNRIQLRNVDYKVTEGLYVMGTLAGERSQLSIAAGSGASLATDLLTIWNDGIPTQSHDKIIV